MEDVFILVDDIEEESNEAGMKLKIKVPENSSPDKSMYAKNILFFKLNFRPL